MFKRGISSLIVFSFIWMDIAPLVAMEADVSPSGHIRRHPNPLNLPLETIESPSPEKTSISPGTSSSHSTESSDEQTLRDIHLSPRNEASETDEDVNKEAVDLGTVKGSVDHHTVTLKEDEALSKSFKAHNPVELQTFPSSDTESLLAIANLESLLGSSENPPRRKGKGERSEDRGPPVTLLPKSPSPKPSSSSQNHTEEGWDILDFLKFKDSDISSSKEDRAHPFSINDSVEDDQAPLLGSSSRRYGTDVEEGTKIETKNTFLLKTVLPNLVNLDPVQAKAAFKEWMEESADLNFNDWIATLAQQHNITLPHQIIKDIEMMTVKDWRSQRSQSSAFDPYDPLIKQAFTHHLLNQFLSPDDNGDDPLNAFLRYFQKHKVKGARSLKQWLLIGGAVLLSAGATISQGIIFGDGLNAFVKLIGQHDNYSDSAADAVISIAMITAFFDSLPRNMGIFSEWGESSTDSFAHPKKPTSKLRTGLKLLTKGSITTLMSAVAFYYFFDVENRFARVIKENGGDPTQCWILLGTLGPFLITDAFIGTWNMLPEVTDMAYEKWSRLRDWMQETFLATKPVLKTIFKAPSLTSEDIERNRFLETLDNVRKSIFQMHPKDIQKIYDDVYKPFLKQKKEEGIEAVDAAEVFLTLGWLTKNLSVEEEVITASSHKPQTSLTWKERLAEGLGAILVTGGSMARYLVYHLVMTEFLNAMGLENKIAVEIISHTLGALGFLSQSLVEQTTIEQNTKGMISDDVHATSSHPWIRKGTNILAGLLGTYFTLPYLVTAHQVMESYTPALLWTSLALAITSDMHTNGWFFKDSFGGYVTLFDQIKEYFGFSISVDRKRDKLITWMDEMMSFAGTADPHVIQLLNQRLEEFHQTGTVNSSKKPSNDDTVVKLDEAS